MYFFIADEHYWHANIISYCERPFKDVEEMNETLVENHNSVVGPKDTTIHIGDFALCKKSQAGEIIARLNGEHIFLQGSHDKWGSNLPFLWEHQIDDFYLVACHYPMLSWPRSHHGSYLLHGHTHGRLVGYPGILDVGVDNFNFYPISFDIVRRRLWR